MDDHNIASLKSLLKGKHQKIIIVTHTNPDGDAIGSSLGLMGILQANGYTNATVVVPNDYPEFLSWMTFNDKVIVAKKKYHRANELIRSGDILFCLDFNSISRTDNLVASITESKAAKVLIDHHPEPDSGFDIVLSDTSVSSTAELVFKLIDTMGWMPNLNLSTAECLYTGIVTDTGSFSYACNNPETYKIVALLMETGINGEEIQRRIYSTFSESRIRLLGFCLAEKLVVIPEAQTAYISITRNELQNHNHQVGDTEGIVNYALSIAGIHLAALFTESHDHIKISFRSSGHIDVNQFARLHFNGGGHRNASGGKSFDTMENTLNKFDTLIRESHVQA